MSDINHSKDLGSTTHAEAKTEPKIFTAASGRQYASVATITDILGVGEMMLRARINKVQKVHPPGFRDPIYSIDDFRADPDIIFRLNTEFKVDDQGFYSEPLPPQEDGSTETALWATVNGFWDTLPPEITDSTTVWGVLLQAQTKCEGRRAVDRNGRTGTQIYRVRDLYRQALAIFHIEKIVDPETTCYTDESGMDWAGKRHWLRTKKVSSRALDNGVKKTFGSWKRVPSEEGRNAIIRDGQVVLAKRIPLYSEEVINQILEFILKAERSVVDGVYYLRDEVSKEIKAVYKTAKELAKEIPVQGETIQAKLLASECPKFRDAVQRHNGVKITVFDLNYARETFKEHIDVALSTDANGEYMHPEKGRCMNLNAYCAEKEHIHPTKLKGIAEQYGLLRLRDTRFNRIVDIYAESDLDAVSGYHLL